MRILTEIEMTAVSGGGRLDSADHDGSSGKSGTSSGMSGGSNRTSDGHTQNSGWGERVGGLVGAAVGGFLGAPAGAFGRVAGNIAGRFGGQAAGHLTEKGFVAGTNAAIDKAVHDAQNAQGRAAASGSRWGGHN